MFGKSAQKRIIRDIDKIVSLKEDLDALSWGRVHEIGRALSSGVDAKEQDALGAELMKIAQANMSMYSLWGVSIKQRPNFLLCLRFFGYTLIHEVDLVPHQEHVDDPDLARSISARLVLVK